MELIIPPPTRSSKANVIFLRGCGTIRWAALKIANIITNVVIVWRLYQVHYKCAQNNAKQSLALILLELPAVRRKVWLCDADWEWVNWFKLRLYSIPSPYATAHSSLDVDAWRAKTNSWIVLCRFAAIGRDFTLSTLLSRFRHICLLTRSSRTLGQFGSRWWVPKYE